MLHKTVIIMYSIYGSKVLRTERNFISELQKIMPITAKRSSSSSLVRGRKCSLDHNGLKAIEDHNLTNTTAINAPDVRFLHPQAVSNLQDHPPFWLADARSLLSRPSEEIPRPQGRIAIFVCRWIRGGHNDGGRPL